MKKLYALFTMLVVAIGLSAQTTTEDVPFAFNVVIDDPTTCYFVDQNNNRVAAVKGDNIIETTLHVTTYTDGGGCAYSDAWFLNLENEADYTISNCLINVNGTESKYDNFYGQTTSLYLSFDSEDMNGCTLNPVITKLEDLRTASCTVHIDDATNVSIRCGSYTPALQTGNNTIKFDPVNEANWTVGPKTYGQYLGGVTVNGTPINESYGQFCFTANNGDIVDIKAQEVVEDRTVNISFANEGTEAALYNVYSYINYQRAPIADWQAGFTIPNRTDIILALNQTDYNITSVTVNGAAQTIYSSDLFITISADANIVVTATAFATIPVDITLSNPDEVTVGVAESEYSGSTIIPDLQAGTQTIQVSEKMQYIIVNVVSGSVIDKVTYTPVGGEATEVYSGYSGYAIPLTPGVAIDVQSHTIVRDAEATLWINDINKVTYLDLSYKDGTQIFNTYGTNVPVTGDQTFKFDPTSDNPFELYFSPTDNETPGYVTINNEKVDPRYENGTSYSLNLKNGDVVRVYANEPQPTNGIESIFGDSNASREIYDLTGRRMQQGAKLAPGIYVVNGKKVVIR